MSDEPSRPDDEQAATVVTATSPARSDVVAPAPDPAAFAAGAVLAGRFTIVRLIGRGGMGEVYEAVDTVLEVRDARPRLERVVAEDNPVSAVEYVDVNASMNNGGGPACLRLRDPPFERREPLPIRLAALCRKSSICSTRYSLLYSTTTSAGEQSVGEPHLLPPLSSIASFCAALRRGPPILL